MEVPEWLRAALWIGTVYLLLCMAGVRAQWKREREKRQLREAAVQEVPAQQQAQQQQQQHQPQDDFGRYRLLGEIGSGGYTERRMCEPVRWLHSR
jgi:hypothetical protein